ncbi:uncharacterized protein LOC134278942 [Saccostrea cucullata]|uniref:uncharacterized protein LOC134278942 n=1 Tax=Saccostrea cuccullata TaxID=36930 RepID=UPI002ED141DB
MQMYCDFCQVNLCISCTGKHISDDYDKHKVVPVQQRKSTLIYPKCIAHQTKSCKYYCEECDISVCSLCSIISDTHKGHTISTLSDVYNAKKEVIENDTEALENIISPTYEEVATDIETQIANLDEEYEKLTTTVTEHGEDCHRVISNIVDKMKVEIEELKIKHKNILKEHLDEIKQIQYRIEQTLLNLYRIEDSKEVFLTMEYIPQTEEFSRLPPKVQVSLPRFSLKTIDTDQFCTLFGYLTPLYNTTEENGYKLKKPVTLSRNFLEEPNLITTINTGYDNLRCVTCFEEEEIWTIASDVSDLKCFSIQGSLIKSIKIKSVESPYDIAVTNVGDLVYSDWGTSTIYKVTNEQIEEVIRFQDWTPLQLCVTSSGDLLVTLYSDDQTQSKVARYSGSIEKQTIQFDDEGKPLYSGNTIMKYITENRNLDICVADCGAEAVVVVNQTGKLRFRYTGHSSTAKCAPFEPYGITTDSQSHILTSDCNNHCIHILDQNGVFLCYIDNCDLKNPYGIYVDKRDNLFVAEYYSGDVKKIKYVK